MSAADYATPDIRCTGCGSNAGHPEGDGRLCECGLALCPDCECPDCCEDGAA